jgi:uncharacterized membrane protein
MMRVFRALMAGLVAAQVAYGRSERLRSPAGTRAIVVLMLSTSLAEAVAARGRRGAAAVAAAGAVGFASELVGVHRGVPYGRYAYSDRLGPRARGVPLLAAAAWAMMARPAWIAAGWVTRRRGMRVPVAAAALTAWDLFLDPRMAREGYWTWERPGRYEGIPASNFAGWFATSLVLFSAMDGREPDADDDGALALYAWTWAGETFAHAALWRRPLVAAAGGAAMGAVAGPAVVRRLVG